MSDHAVGCEQSGAPCVCWVATVTQAPGWGPWSAKSQERGLLVTASGSDPAVRCEPVASPSVARWE